MRVLVVDDEVRLTRHVASTLTVAGHDPVVIHSGKAIATSGRVFSRDSVINRKPNERPELGERYELNTTEDRFNQRRFRSVRNVSPFSDSLATHGQNPGEFRLQEDPTMSIFAKRLSTARGMRGLSQKGLASKTGLQQVAISFFETGRRTPSLGNLRRLADALEVTTDYLMGRSDFAESPVQTLSSSLRNDRSLSSKDVKVLRRLVEKIMRAKNRQQQPRGGRKGNSDVALTALFS